MKRKVLLLGSSHLGAVWEGLQQGAPSSIDINVRFLMDFRKDSRVVIWDDQPRLLPEVEELVENASAFEAIFLSVSGSDYLELCLTEAVDFDFASHGLPDDDSVSRRIPFAEIKAALAHHIRHVVETTKLVAKKAPVPLYYLESPPPIGDNDFLTAHPSWAAPAFAKAPPANPILRLKMWRLHSQIVREICTKCGVKFVAVPESVMDSRGMLVRDAYRDDIMHANAWYGSQIVVQANSLIS